MKQKILLQERVCLVFLILTLFLFSHQDAFCNEYQQVAGLLDIKTDYSDGAHDLDFLVRLAKERGFRVLFVTDHDRMAMQYGLFPFRHLIGLKIEKPSINKKGVKAYLDMIKNVQDKHPDMILIPGTESAAHYYWSGSPLKKNLTAHNWEKHILIVGLEKPEDYKNLPVIHNGFSTKYTSHLLPNLLLPFFVLIIGLFLLIFKGLPRKLGIILSVIGITLIININPLRSSPYDQYQGDEGMAPYQFLIDYVHSKGGMTFWNNMETKSGVAKKGPVFVNTPPHPEVLEQSHSYAGFSALYGANITVNEPGKEWDKTLIDFCKGSRSNTPFGISTADFHKDGWAGDPLGKYPTIFLVKKFDKESILSAMRNGRMYSYQGDYKTGEILERFEITDRASGNSGIQGEKILSKGPVTVRIAVRSRDRSSRKIRIRLIRNGNLIKVFQDKTPFQTAFRDDYFKPGQKTYYRLDLRGRGILVSNPVFLEFVK